MGRYAGTGKDELGRYPKGAVVDADEEAAKGLVERGWIEAVDEADDPGRTPRWQLAAAAVRNDAFSDPQDRAAAVEAGFIEEHEGTSAYTATPEAYRVAGDEPAEEAEPAPTRRRKSGG